jgi:tetratricopeptide (TPR) repeat protein
LPSALAEGVHDTSPVEQVSARFLGALEQLERRIRQLEHNPGSSSASPDFTESATAPITETTIEAEEPVKPTNAKPRPTPSEARDDKALAVNDLLRKGEQLLGSERAEDALECFEQIIVLDGSHVEAMIRRGQALEKLQRMEAALESYNQAIAQNNTSTLAYLHKGAVCNRLQRYREALECYEKALQAEQRT